MKSRRWIFGILKKRIDFGADISSSRYLTISSTLIFQISGLPNRAYWRIPGLWQLHDPRQEEFHACEVTNDDDDFFVEIVLVILKNFSQLVMGFGLMFRVDEESAERHKGERKAGEIFYTFSSEYSNF